MAELTLIGSVAEKILANASKKPAYAALFSDWKKIVGENIAEVCFPEKVTVRGNKRALILKVKKGCSLEIQHESDNILNIINNFFGDKLFDNLVIFQMDFEEAI